jgi:hypothetical protein
MNKKLFFKEFFGTVFVGIIIESAACMNNTQIA